MRTWLITGGSRGVGRAIAQLAVARGDPVALMARGPEVKAVAHDLGELALGVQGDVGDVASLERAIRAVVEAFGRVDVLVNNAGLHRGGLIDRVDSSDFVSVVAVDLVAPWHLCRLAIPHMQAGGSIVNIGSVIGFRGFPGDSPYGAAKAGLAGLTMVLAIELSRREITVNLVAPGFTETEMTGAVDDRARDRILRGIPLGRIARAEEIARVVVCVADTPYMTGAVVPVDGGLMAALPMG